MENYSINTPLLTVAIIILGATIIFALYLLDRLPLGPHYVNRCDGGERATPPLPEFDTRMSNEEWAEAVLDEIVARLSDTQRKD